MTVGQQVVKHIDAIDAAAWQVVRHVQKAGFDFPPVRIGPFIATGVNGRVIVSEQVQPGVFAPAWIT